MRSLLLIATLGTAQLASASVWCGTADGDEIYGNCKVEFTFLSPRYPPVLVREEAFAEADFNFLHIKLRNQVFGDFDSYIGPHFSGANVWWENSVEIYGVPGGFDVVGDIELTLEGLLDVAWTRDVRVDSVDPNRINITMAVYPPGIEDYPRNGDLWMRLKSIKLFDPLTGEQLKGYSYSPGPAPGVMVGSSDSPEPATVGLMAGSLLALVALRNRKVARD